LFGLTLSLEQGIISKENCTGVERWGPGTVG